jgi:hypothetical protein
MAVCKGLSATNAKRAAYYIKGDRRCKRETAVKKALCVILYGLGKASFSMFGKILNHAPPIIYRWINEAMDKTLEPSNSGDIREIEFDEWRKNKVILSLWGMVKMRCWGSSMAFSSKKKVKNSGPSSQRIVAEGELLPGLQGTPMLQRSSDFMKK